MLTFIGYAETRLELDVLGYQFPNAKLDGWDSEWLIVAGAVSCDRGSWKFREPCLTTFELQALAKWFRAPGNKVAPSEIGFTEPNLSFARAELAKAEELIVSFEQESAPPWATEREIYQKGFSISFPAPMNDFDALAASIDKILERFPERYSRRDVSS